MAAARYCRTSILHHVYKLWVRSRVRERGRDGRRWIEKRGLVGVSGRVESRSGNGSQANTAQLYDGGGESGLI